MDRTILVKLGKRRGRADGSQVKVGHGNRGQKKYGTEVGQKV